MIDRARSLYRRQVGRARDVIDRIGPARAEADVVADAEAYWREPTSPAWKGNSHWYDGIPENFGKVGADHLALLRKLSGVLDRETSLGRVLEWGSGGGANAVAFGPEASEFIAVDVVAESLVECEARFRAACDTPFRSVVFDVARPEDVVAQLGAACCDVFLCVYVFELVPSPAYALRVLDAARELLAPGGTALIQVKYRDWASRKPPKRNYARNVAAQTVFPIDKFWTAAGDHGLTPQAVYLVPRNELDRNYAYFLLTRA